MTASTDTGGAAPSEGEGRDDDRSGAWSDAVAAALVGTARRPTAPGRGGSTAPVGRGPRFGEEPRVGAPGGESGTGSSPLERTLAEAGGELLVVASVLAAYREAGRVVPVDARPPPEPASADDRPLPSDRATEALVSILEERSYAPLLAEWLRLAEGAGVRLPPEIIPSVFDAVGPAHRPAAAPLAGPLGTWLAARNEAWTWAVGADVAVASGTWEELERAWGAEGDARRQIALAGLRALDPDRARALLEATWATEPPAMRALALDELVNDLGPSDEPLLETALDDRRKDVRQRAVRLLAGLTGSRRAARMAARSVPLVTVEGRLRKRLNIDLPSEVDAAMKRDGVEPKPPSGGERQWWFFQLVAGTPLAAWTESLGRPPAELVALAQASDAHGLLGGWAAAAVSQRDPAWARAVLDGGGAPPGTEGDLATVLPDDEADRAVTAWLRRSGLVPSLSILTQGGRVWSLAVTEAVISALADLLKTTGTTAAPGAWAVHAQLPALALSLHPAAGEAAATTLAAALDAVPPKEADAARSFWQRPLATFGSLLHFRHLLHEEFR